MSRFIELRGMNDQPIMVNVALIETVAPCIETDIGELCGPAETQERGCIVVFSGGKSTRLHVKDKYNDLTLSLNGLVS